MKYLYVAWQDPDSRSWHTVGRLTREEKSFKFVYTQGSSEAKNFGYLGRMKERHLTYRSESLFPLFSNRLLDRSRPEYPKYLEWLGLDKADDDPMLLLARSGGGRATDHLCVYPHPEPKENGEVELYFFSHGLKHLDSASHREIAQLKPGDVLRITPENDNPYDRFALVLETSKSIKVGYCPRYLNQDLQLVMNVAEMRLTVERVNVSAPQQFRLLCRAAFMPPAGFELFKTEAHQPIQAEAVAA